MLRRIVVLLLVAGVAGPAWAQSVHLKPPHQNPTFYDLGLALNTQGQLAGLGNADVLVTLTAAASVTATCTNQGGGEAPGQNPAPITVAGSEAIPASEIKNGTTPFNVTTDAPPSTISGAPGCPNPNWTETIVDLAFTSAILTVEQPPGTAVLTVSCTFNPPTSNGLVPSGNVTCTIM